MFVLQEGVLHSAKCARTHSVRILAGTILYDNYNSYP
jgi:hypothetical protein